MIVDAVFEGGGAKGIALSGGVKALEERGIQIRRFVGTSAGAITATNLAVGYSADDVLQGSLEKTPDGKSIYTTFSDGAGAPTNEELLGSGIGKIMEAVNLPFISAKAEQRMDLVALRALMAMPGMKTIFSMLELGGMNAGDAFLEWMVKTLEARCPNLGKATFEQIFEHTGADLTVVATDTTARGLLVLNHRTAPKLPVSWGVRMSMSIPFFWVPVHWRKEWGAYMGNDITGHEIVDGGVLSNFPMRLIADTGDDDVIRWMGPPPPEVSRPIGFYLDADLPVPGQPVKCERTIPQAALVERIEALIDTMMSAGDNTVIAAHEGYVVRLPVKGYGTTDFDLSDARVRALFDAGTEATRAYLAAEEAAFSAAGASA